MLVTSCRSLAFSLLTVTLTAACAPHHVVTQPGDEGERQDVAAASGVTAPNVEDFIQRWRDSSKQGRVNVVKTGLATVESTNGHLAAALAALTVFPSAQRHIDVADAYRGVQILDKAHLHFSLAVSMDRRNARAYDGMARIWRDWGFPNVALADAHRAVYFAPRSAEAHNTLGTVLHALRALPEARNEYEKALSLNPSAAYALNNLCALDLAAGDPASAVRRCEEATRLDPGLTLASRNLEQARSVLRATSVEAPDGQR